jgi:hypothetical protein
VRGTGIGAFFGVLPGTGPAIASFASYMVEKKVARDPSRFGRGAIEGVAGPEAANNADAQCKFIPMLTLGLPASGVMALMLGALTPFPERAGAASSLLGFLQQATASAIGIVVGQMLGSSALPLAAVIAAMGVLALALALYKRAIGPV